MLADFQVCISVPLSNKYAPILRGQCMILRYNWEIGKV